MRRSGKVPGITVRISKKIIIFLHTLPENYYFLVHKITGPCKSMKMKGLNYKKKKKGKKTSLL